MDWEFLLLDSIQQYLKSDFMDSFMKAVSFTGQLGMIWILLSVVTFFFRKTRRFSLTLAAANIFNLIAGNLIIKNIVSRPRPCWLNHSIEMITAIPSDTSFPSGHTLFAFSAATVIFYYHKGLGVAAYLFALLMGFSRMYLYVHFPTDVIFGAIFGVIFASVVIRLFNLAVPPWGSAPTPARGSAP